MSESDQSYSLRPKRTTKGKYREMVGINSKKADQEAAKQGEEKSRKIIYLPLEVKEGAVGGDLSSSGIEIEILDDVSVSELTDEVHVDGSGTEQELAYEEGTPTAANPSQHIDEILQKNDEVLDSIPEGPRFKKRKTKGTADDKIILSLETVKEMMERSLTDEEESTVSYNFINFFLIFFFKSF